MSEIQCWFNYTENHKNPMSEIINDGHKIKFQKSLSKSIKQTKQKILD